MVYQPAAGLRSRKVDMKKHLPVYHLSELPDLDEVSASLPTAQTTVSTGVEKEEEAVLINYIISLFYFHFI